MMNRRNFFGTLAGAAAAIAALRENGHPDWLMGRKFPPPLARLDVGARVERDCIHIAMRTWVPLQPGDIVALESSDGEDCGYGMVIQESLQEDGRWLLIEPTPYRPRKHWPEVL